MTEEWNTGIPEELQKTDTCPECGFWAFTPLNEWESECNQCGLIVDEQTNV